MSEPDKRGQDVPAGEAGGGASVTVVGGGIAGLSAALRLAERGYAVKLYEQKPVLGGNLASRPRGPGEPALDIYPHMFQGWYENFWQLMEDVGVKQQDSFSPFSSVYQLRRPKKGKVRFEKLTNPYSPETLIENMFSGLASPADMFIFGYASLDLQAETVSAERRLRNMSLTGYLQSRPYMTPAALAAYEAFVLRVWGIPAYLISAVDCRTYAAYCFGAAEQPGWLTSASAQTTVIDPIVKALKDHGADVETGVTVSQVTVKPTKKKQRFEVATMTTIRDGKRSTEPVENLVLAVPPAELSHLVRHGTRGSRIVDALPGLVELARLTSQSIPVLSVAINKKLPGLPREPVAIYGSKLNLAFIDISQLWAGHFAPGKTVLAVSCSERFRLSGPSADDNAFEMLTELAKFLPFEPGDKWEDPSSDIDWVATAYEPNADAQLTLNTIGTDAWRPHPAPKWVPNLFFAGDFCLHDFGITTVEAAVATGLAAAKGVVERVNLGDPVEILRPQTLPSEMFLVLRYSLVAAAYAAMGWSRMTEDDTEPPWNPDQPGKNERMIAGGPSTLRYLFTPGLPPREKA